MSKKKGDGDILKDLMKTAGTAKVREALGDYLKALKTCKEGNPCEPQGPFSIYPSYALYCGLDSQDMVMSVRLQKQLFMLQDKL